MKYTHALALALIVFPCVAQEIPKADLFLGYSFLRANSARNIPAFTANGGLGTIAWDVNNHFALEAEFGGHHNGNINNHELDTTTMTYLFGPRVSYGRSSKVSPYGHILFGGMHFMTSIAANSVLLPTPSTGSNGRYSTSQDAFAMAVGGGIDVKLSKHVTFRPIQLDYLMSRLQDLGLTGTSTNRNQNSLRYAAGLLFTFGGERPAPISAQPTTKTCADGSSIPVGQNCPNRTMEFGLSAAQTQVCPGGIVKITPSVALPPEATTEWTVNGEPTSQGATFDFGSSGRTPGAYKVALRVTAPGYETATSETTVNVVSYQPPSGTVQASTPEIWAGEKTRLTANFNAGQCGSSLRPATFTASEGAVDGSEFDSSGVQFDPADKSEQRKSVTITASAADEGGTGTAQTTVVVKKRAAVEPTRLPDIIFPRGSSRVNNCGKRVLLETLKTHLTDDPNGKVVLVGHTVEGEHAADLDRARALNAAAVISAGQGICLAFPASQILIGTAGSNSNGVDNQPNFCGTSTERPGQAVRESDPQARDRRVEVWFVPSTGVVPTSTTSYQDAAALSVATLGCPK